MGRKGEEKETHRWEGARRGTRDLLNVGGILMSRKVFGRKLRRNNVIEKHTHVSNTLRYAQANLRVPQSHSNIKV